MKRLVIVESPAKARTIERILPTSGYTIKASMGHIRDLPEKTFGVDIDNHFTPQYLENKGRSKNLAELKSAAKSAQEIYLASDPDREGEAIAWHLREVLGKLNSEAKFYRVTFHEITKSAITQAFKSPGEINMQRVDAQQARRVLDRIVGYKISPLLWSRIERGLSAGRVQSVALRLVCEREREIQKFTPQEYWTYEAKFAISPKESDCYISKLAKIDQKNLDISNQEKANYYLDCIKKVNHWNVSDINVTRKKRNPMPPFITSTMQQAASSSLGYSASKTMQLAQQLYEGVPLDNGPVGLITYMRTDAVAIAAEAQKACRNFISEKFGADFIPSKPINYRSKENAQGAHECIRPTDINLTPESVRSFLTPEQWKLYSLIWRRFVACQMVPACVETTTVVTSNGTKSKASQEPHLFEFRSSVSVITFNGYLAVYNINEETHKLDQDEKQIALDTLRKISMDSQCTLKECRTEQKFTEPPPRFSEATLIKELETNGIGRPSTYASIVNTIESRNYTTKEKGKLFPTELGFRINDFLVFSLPDLFQVSFTADMEEKLDKIEDGEEEWTNMLEDFYSHFIEWLENAKFKDAPQEEKILDAVNLIKDFKDWILPEKIPGRRIFNEKKFVESVITTSDNGKKLTAKQWNALFSIVVKYRDKLPGFNEMIKKNHLEDELQEILRKEEKYQEIQKERNAERKNILENFTPDENLEKIFKISKKVKWKKQTKARSKYDDAAFVKSLREQYENGKVLSDKQLNALFNIIHKYPDDFKDCSIPSISKEQEKTSFSQEHYDELQNLLNKFDDFKDWKEPQVRRGHTYDDKKFIASLASQFQKAKSLSDKQEAALKRLVEKYNLFDK